VSYVLLWQPSECVYLINDCVVLFSGNKYDDDESLMSEILKHLCVSCMPMPILNKYVAHYMCLPIKQFRSFLARRSMSEALLLQAFRLDHLSVRICEQWPHP